MVKGKQNQTTNPRLPITPAILITLKRAWLSRTFDSFDRAMLWAAALLCFFGFFRAGKLIIYSDKAFNQNIDLSFADMAVDDLKSPTLLQIHLKAFKMDPFRSGVDAFVGKLRNNLCPTTAMTRYLSQVQNFT